MKRKFITNLALVIFLNLLVKPFWIFGIDRTVQNVVGAEEYGFYFSLFNFSLLLNILLDAGLTSWNNRTIAREPGRLSELFSSALSLKLMLAVVYALTCFLIALLVDYEAGQLKMLGALVFNQFLASFILYLRSNISGLHYFRTDSLISVLDRGLVILFCGSLLWGNITDQAFRIEWFVYAQTLAYLLTALLAFVVVLRRAGRLRLRIHRSTLLPILRSSYPFALLILLMSFYNRIDSIMLERMLTDGRQEAGIYAQSFRILDAAAMFAFLFSGLLLPIFSRMLKQKEAVGEILTLSYTLLMVPAIILAALSAWYGLELIDWMYREHSEESARIFPLLMFGFLAISTTYVFGTLLTSNGNLKELNILALSAVLLNVLLNILLIPGQKAVGAAIASLVTQTYMAIAQVLLTVFRIRTEISRRVVFKLILFAALTFLMGYACRQFIERWYAGLILMIALSVSGVFLMGLLKFRDIYRIVRFDQISAS